MDITNATSNGARVVEALRARLLSSLGSQCSFNRITNAFYAADGVIAFHDVVGAEVPVEVQSFQYQCSKMQRALIGGGLQS